VALAAADSGLWAEALRPTLAAALAKDSKVSGKAPGKEEGKALGKVSGKEGCKERGTAALLRRPGDGAALLRGRQRSRATVAFCSSVDQSHSFVR